MTTLFGSSKLSRGASLRGQGTPADPARLRSVRARNSANLFAPQANESKENLACGFLLLQTYRSAADRGSCGERKLALLLAAEKLVPLNGGDHAYRAFFARLGALHAPEAAYAHGASQGNFVRQGQQNFNGRAFFDIFGAEEIK